MVIATGNATVNIARKLHEAAVNHWQNVGLWLHAQDIAREAEAQAEAEAEAEAESKAKNKAEHYQRPFLL